MTMKDTEQNDASNTSPASRPGSGDTDSGAAAGASKYGERTFAGLLKRKSLLVAGIVLALLVVSAVAYTTLFNKPVQKDANDPLAAATVFESPQALVDEAVPNLKGSVLEPGLSNGVGAYDADGYYIYAAPAYKVPGTDFAVLPLTSTGQGYIGDSERSAANYESLVKFFVDNEFVEKRAESNMLGTVAATEDYVRYERLAEYESSNLLCRIHHVDATPTRLAGHLVSIGCADKASYGDAAKGMKPFYEAYKRSNSDTSADLVFGLQASGNNNEYAYALLYQEDARQFDTSGEVTSLTGYYYMAKDDAEWTYVDTIKTSETPYCSLFAREPLKKAFAGVDCFDDASQQLVKL